MCAFWVLDLGRMQPKSHEMQNLLLCTETRDISQGSATLKVTLLLLFRGKEIRTPAINQDEVYTPHTVVILCFSLQTDSILNQE